MLGSAIRGRAHAALCLALAGCSFSGSAASDDADDDGGAWTIDSTADFTAPGSWRTGAIAGAPGPADALTIGAYAHGTLAAAGRTGCGIGPGQQASIAWRDVATSPLALGLGVPDRPMVDGVPPGLGLAGDAFTAWWEGEVWLEVGTHAFHLIADDRAFLEIGRVDGWQRVAAEGEATADVEIPATAWYPLRVALADCGGAQGFAIAHRAPGAADEIPLSPARLRAIANGAQGLVAEAFDDRALLVPAGVAPWPDALVGVDWADAQPLDRGLTSGETWSMRWSGQVRIDGAGDYAFHIHSDNGHRLRLDGALVLDFMSFGATVEDRTSTPIALTAGWHDLVLDYQEDTGAANVDFAVATGPDLAGMHLPADRLRPLPGPAGRLVARAFHPAAPIPDQATVTVPVRIEAPPGATVDRVNLGYTISHGYPHDLVITLVSPAGTPRIFRDRESVGSPIVDRWVEAAAFAGQDPSGTWTLAVQDAAAIDVGTIDDVALTVHYVGGDAARPAAATWTSELHPVGATRALGPVTWVATTPGGSSVELEVRTCTGPDACGDLVQVVHSGDVPAVAPGGYVQARATLYAAGEDVPTIDSITIALAP